MRKYQYYDTGDDGDYDGYTANWIAQTFTVVSVHMISKVLIKLFRVGTPGTIQVSIKETTLGKPSGSDLCEGTIEGTEITDNTDGEWYTISLGSGYTFDANTQYAIVVRAIDGDISNKISWRGKVGSSTYPGGTYASSSDSGTDWGTISGSDLMFEEWGVGEPNPSTSTWGLLPKSQVDAETIEEAIDRVIEEHNDDETAHIGTGQSLEAHKSAEEIDHPVESVETENLVPRAVTVDRLNEDKSVFRSSFESLDTYTIYNDTEFSGFATAGAECLAFLPYILNDWVTLTLERQLSSVLSVKNPNFQITIDFSFAEYDDFDLGVCVGSRYPLEPTADIVGFRWIGADAKMYCYSGEIGAKEETEVVGFDPDVPNVFRAAISEAGDTVKFYINSTLVATHDGITLDIDTSEMLGLTIKEKTLTSNAMAILRDFTFFQDW